MQDQEIQEPEQTVQSVEKETGVILPVSLIRWLCYTTIFGLMLLPFYIQDGISFGKYFGVCLVLGHFAGQLNKIIDK
jgi:hypothetical protein